ncbi:hypothetical protein ACFOMD_17240 [Sphingoaurantiacus capsulatus]|uniref:Uncharacterized protein n=1 Tax=Sphingoaurantiacus capsulatus TaxID=1771310 RepID=A0ABV7XGA0_9SPHN
MISLSDAASLQGALNLCLEPALLDLLRRRIERLQRQYDGQLLDQTHILIVEPGDTEEDIQREVGFSPLESPYDRARYGAPDFHPFWDWLQLHGGWFELIQTVGNSGFAYVLFIKDVVGVPEDLLRLCREYAT